MKTNEQKKLTNRIARLEAELRISRKIDRINLKTTNRALAFLFTGLIVLKKSVDRLKERFPEPTKKQLAAQAKLFKNAIAGQKESTETAIKIFDSQIAAQKELTAMVEKIKNCNNHQPKRTEL